MVLGHFAPHGIAEADLPHRLGTSPAEAAQTREILLRRRLVQRDPPGRYRVGARLVLTERGRRAISSLDQFLASLPASVFDPGELPTTGESGADQTVPGWEPPGPALTSPHLRPGLLWWGREEAPERTAGFEPIPEEGIFERGLLNVWLATALFLAAVVVGVLHQSERAGLTALGVGCFIALVFLGRAAFVLVRQHRVRTAPARMARAAARRPRRLALGRVRPHSGRSLR